MKHTESFHGIHTRLENKEKNTLRMHTHTYTHKRRCPAAAAACIVVTLRGSLYLNRAALQDASSSSGCFQEQKHAAGQSVCTEAGCRLSAAPKTKLPPSECLLWLFSPLFHFFIFLFLYSHQHFLCQESNKGVFTQRLKTGRLPN